MSFYSSYAPDRRDRIYFYAVLIGGAIVFLSYFWSYNANTIPPDVARRNVPPTTLGKFRHLSSPTTTMLTASFPCMVLHRRNLACIGCGCPRGGGMSQSQQLQQSNRTLSSPRFSSFSPHNPPTLTSNQPQQPPQYIYSQPSPPAYNPSPMQPSKSTHPLLTPSGRAFAVGGKVQNISSDPLSPCIMYWPDNEPLPEQGQIRPSGLVGVPVSHLFPKNEPCLISIAWMLSSLPSSTLVTEGLFRMYAPNFPFSSQH